MAVSEQVTCDGCGAVKGEANHWLLVRSRALIVTFTPWGPDYKDHQHVCGEACAGKMLAKAITDWRAADAPKGAE